MSIDLLIFKNKARLDKLVSENADYDKILKQSQQVNKYVAIKMREQLKSTC